MDKQEVFTKVTTHLLTQKQRAEVLRSDGILCCSYRGHANYVGITASRSRPLQAY